MNNISSPSFCLVIFGITGNLAQLKLIPALYDLTEAGLLPESMSIIGIGRKKYSPDEFRQYIADILAKPSSQHQHHILPESEKKLQKQISYLSGDAGTPETYQLLSQQLCHQTPSNKIYYLATYPDLYATIFDQLESNGLNKQDQGWVRVMIEKPMGSDLESAKSLNRLLSKYYVEDQIFRLDHYLGKETLQNILTFRFGNSLYEPIMNRDYVDHIQVTMAENFGIGDRSGFYDTVGALKDVGQNHLLQMIALTTMSAPSEFTNPAITASRVQLIENLVPEPDKVVFGQYQGYLQEKDVQPNSSTETFFAFRTHIKEDKLKDVPIYVRAGKNLQQNVAEVSVVFKVNDQRLFRHLNGGLDSNVLIYRIQPNEGIVLKILSKTPGPELKLQDDYMQFCYRQNGQSLPDPYLKLLLDALHGDQTFFIDAPEVEAQWKFTDSLVKKRCRPEIYPTGTWGPKSADKLIEADGRHWLIPSPIFCSK